MPDMQEIVRRYLEQVTVMQLATSANDQPWVCNVHYYCDQKLDIFWVSTTSRRHSQEISKNPKVGATVLAHVNTPAKNYVVGISIAGVAELIGEQVDEQVGVGYVTKHNKDDSFLADIASGKNPHKFYRLRPSQIVLFDSKHFPDNPRQEWFPAN